MLPYFNQLKRKKQVSQIELIYFFACWWKPMYYYLFTQVILNQSHQLYKMQSIIYVNGVLYLKVENPTVVLLISLTRYAYTIRPHLILQIIFVVCIYIFITCYRVNFHNLTLNHHIWTIQSPLCFCLKPQWYLAVFLLVIKMGTTKAPLLSQSSKGN